jgi:tRNA A37 threonylcarbamoyladenosine dehydratase
MSSKDKNERLSLALRKNLKKRKLFQKKIKKNLSNVYSA